MSRNQSRFISGESINEVSGWTFSAVDQQSDRFAAKLRAQAVQEAEERADLIRQAGYSEGYAAGFSKGYEQGVLEGQQKLDEYVATTGAKVAESFGQLFVSASNQMEALEQSIAAGVLEMASSLARQILRQELSVNPNVLQPVIKEALSALVQENRPAVVRLNPVDADVFSDTIRDSFPGFSLSILPDTKVTHGGCLVECAGTVVDGTVENRWQRALSSIGLQSEWEGEHDGA
jgi:flagellar assembly protein FliH